jgi:hypothetical protein
MVSAITLAAALAAAAPETGAEREDISRWLAADPLLQQDEIIVEEDDDPDVIVINEDDDDVDAHKPYVGISAGGGVTSFSDSDVRDLTADAGGAYTARLHIGTTTPVGFELGYIGTASELDVGGLDSDALLISNGAEGAITLGLPMAVRPYLVGGAAWKHYSVERTDIGTAAVNDDDDVFEIPAGVGVGFNAGPALLDLRGVYRWAFDEDLLTGADDDLDNWDVTLRAGMTF